MIDLLRAPKVLDMAIFDWVGSIVFAVLIGKFMLRLSTPQTWAMWVTLWIAFGVLIHKALGVDTMFGYYLGLNPKPQRPVCA